MVAKTGILQDKNGNNSSARVIGTFVVGNAVMMLWACIVFGFFHPEQFVAVVGIGTGLFTGVTTGTFVYLYNNKKKELDKLPNVVPLNPEQEQAA